MSIVPRLEVDVVTSYDVLVAGGGPAGTSAAAALADRGLEIACVDPVQPPEWPNTYGIWVDELREAGLEGCAQRQWAAARIELDDDRHHRLERAYALVDNAALRAELRSRAERGSVTWLEDAVTGVDDSGGTLEVQLRSGETRQTRLVVDATGHAPMLANREPGNPGFQTAYGIEATCRPPPTSDDEMVLMDFRTDHLDDADVDDEPPTFLYVMELDDGRYLLEETTLVGRPPVERKRLEDRLRRRLDARNLRVDVGDDEHVRIPMGLPLPAIDPGSGIVPFGGAASMVHPASGYMLGRVLNAAAPMARAVDEALAEQGTEAAVRSGWRAIWPPSRRRARELFLFGMETLLAMDTRQTSDFFDAFFSLEQRSWRDFLSGRISAARTAGIMWQVFEALGLGLKGALARRALSPSGKHLLRSLRA